MNKQIRLKIGGVPEHFNLPWRLAIEEGETNQLGLQLHWSDMTGGTGQMIRGLETGSLDIAVLLTEGITKSILQGLDAKVIGVYVETPLRWGVHVPTKSSFQKNEDVENQTFAISRYGSGSHLMSYIMADTYNWDLSALKFNVIGDLYGGLWALENNEAQIFLWEKTTTQPFVEQGKCRYIGDVVTPWPCFVVAVRTEVYEKYTTEIKQLLEVVNQKAFALKNNPEAAQIISWRCNLDEDKVREWLSETDWNYSGALDESIFEKTIHYLHKVGLVSESESENWKQKLF